MCMGGKNNFMKTALTLGAIAAGAYFTGGGSLSGLGSMFGGSGASAAQAAAAKGAFFGSGMPAVEAAASSALPSLSTLAYWGGQGLNAAGTVSKLIGERQMMGDINSANRYNTARNAQLISEANDVNNKALSNFNVNNQNAMLDNAYASRLAALGQSRASDVYSKYLPSTDSMPKEVKDAIESRSNDIINAGRKQNEAGARLNSYADLNANNAINLNNSGQKIATLQNFLTGNNNVLQNQINTAMIKPRNATTIGGLLSGAGLLSNAYSATRPA